MVQCALVCWDAPGENRNGRHDLDGIGPEENAKGSGSFALTLFNQINLTPCISLPCISLTPLHFCISPADHLLGWASFQSPTRRLCLFREPRIRSAPSQCLKLLSRLGGA
jgi:hypothetical protein